MPTKDQFREKEREKALELAPANEITENEFRERIQEAPILALRLAATWWSAPRGRSRAAVIDGIVAALQNPHTNQGDSYRVALGHIRACELQIRRTS